MVTGADDTEAATADKINTNVKGSDFILTAEPIKDQSHTEDEGVPVAKLVSNWEKIVIPPEKVHVYNGPNEPSEEVKEPLIINELKKKTMGKEYVSDVSKFIEKIKTAPCGNLRPKSISTSPSYQDILNVLHESYMGDFDFASVIPIKSPKTIPKHYNDKVIQEYLGETWMKKSWDELDSDVSSELSKQIKEKLKDLARKTMAHLPSLAPKTTYERDALENWLIDGLLLAYPTLTSGVIKNDAIALILLAALSKAFTNAQNDQAIGDLPDKFPIDQFKCVADQSKEAAQDQMLESLFRIIKEKNLPYAGKVVKVEYL